jgi:ketosteroid isomerase-like protein
MSDHPNIARMREGYDAFAKGDLAVLDELLAEDIRWHLPGRNQLSGTYQGRAAVYESFGRVMAVTEGSFRVEVRALLADDEYAMASVDITAHSGDRSFAVRNAHVFRFSGEKAVEFWETSGDQHAQDAVFG